MTSDYTLRRHLAEALAALAGTLHVFSREAGASPWGKCDWCLAGLFDIYIPQPRSFPTAFSLRLRIRLLLHWPWANSRIGAVNSQSTSYARIRPKRISMADMQDNRPGEEEDDDDEIDDSVCPDSTAGSSRLLTPSRHTRL